jgi:dTDP-4-dehydrorhamnose 3,5-epimerase
MPISIAPTAIPDLLVVEPKVFGDDRGWFFESFNEKDFSAALGKQVNFVQDNHSFSEKGVLRGLHYQTEQTQGKLVRVCHGAVFDVAVDLRKTSSTFGKWVGLELSAENKKQLWIPAGFAHGFLVLSETVEVLYKTTNYWDAASEKCIIWNDPTLNINWPDIGVNPRLSFKDLNGLVWTNASKFEFL